MTEQQQEHRVDPNDAAERIRTSADAAEGARASTKKRTPIWSGS